MGRFPCNTTIIGEFGKRLKEMANPVRQHDAALRRICLQLYSKSGKHDFFDPMAYSDPDKVTKRVDRPSLTILAEGASADFFAALDPTLLTDGFLPRFMLYEYRGQRAYHNKAAKDAYPSSELIEQLRSFMAACNTNRASQQRAYEVPLAPDAEAKFDEFDRWTTDRMNSGSEITKHLWNRAHLKGLKLAALAAVSDNWFRPKISFAHTVWATNLIVAQTNNLIGKFENGEVGEEAGDQAKQQRLMRKVIREYLMAEPGKYLSSGCTKAMHDDRIFTKKYLSDRLIKLAAYKNDKLGGTHALKRTIDFLMEADEIRRVGTTDLMKFYQTGASSFGCTNWQEFLHRDD
jgi:hypothetical protein